MGPSSGQWSTRDPRQAGADDERTAVRGHDPRDHVTLEVECLDRLYLNVYVPTLQRVAGVLASSATTVASRSQLGPDGPDQRRLRGGVKAFAEREDVPLIDFKRGQRKDDIAKEHLARFSGDEGVLFIGPSPGEDDRLPHREAPQPDDRPAVRLDRALDRDRQPVLHLRRRP